MWEYLPAEIFAVLLENTILERTIKSLVGTIKTKSCMGSNGEMSFIELKVRAKWWLSERNFVCGHVLKREMRCTRLVLDYAYVQYTLERANEDQK